MKKHISPEVIKALIKVISSCNGITEIRSIATECAALFALEHGKPAPRKEIIHAITAAIRYTNKAMQNAFQPDGSVRIRIEPPMMFQLSTTTVIPAPQATKNNLMEYTRFRKKQLLGEQYETISLLCQ